MGFASGFSAGSAVVDSIQNHNRQKVLDERAARDDEQRQVQYKRTLGLQAKEDSAVGSLEAVGRGIVQGGNWSTPQGYSADGPEPQNMQPDPSVGMQTRPASDKEYNQAFQNVALAKRDMAGLATLRTEGKNIDYNDSIVTSNASWDGKSNEEKSALIKQFSYDQSIRGHGNWIKGSGKTEGYMNFMPDNGDPMQLSNKEVRDLFSLTNAMKIDPGRARKEMDGVSDKVRAMAKEVFDTNLKTAKEVNDTRKDQGTLAIMQQNADQTGAHQRGLLAVARAGQASRGKEADPTLVKKNNELYDSYINEPDPVKRAGIDRQMQMVQNQIATSLGKAQMLPNSRGERPVMTNKDLLDFVEKNPNSPIGVNNPKKPGTSLTVSEGNPAQVRAAAEAYFGVAQRDSGTALPNVATPARGDVDTRLPPVDQPRQYDSDGFPIPMGPALVSNGYGTGPDVRKAARGLLRTPNYSAGGTNFNPN